MIRERARQVILVLLMITAIVFPFSVAATNIALGSTLGVGILSGMWWQGLVWMWQRYRWLCVAAMTYWGLMVLGLVWSGDRMWGVHVLGRQWYWLLVPLVMFLLDNETWRRRFLGLLSLGLTAHLLFCVLQMFGYVTGTNAGGSGIKDATGHIGHIGFGVVYGMWAGWLLLWGWRQTGWRRLAAWLVAGWAWAFIFMAQGRSGYIVTLILFLAVLWKILSEKDDWRGVAWVVGVIVLVSGIVAVGPAKERLQVTWQNIQAIERGDMRDAGPRWSMWRAALDAWRMHPVLGVGTGGFPNASVEMARLHPELNYDGPAGHFAAHPHNMYLLALARWSVWGIGALLFLIYTWVRTGWRMDWGLSGGGALISLSGIALAIHGFTAPSLEEHFEDILAVLFLGVGLSYRQGRAI